MVGGVCQESEDYGGECLFLQVGMTEGRTPEALVSRKSGSVCVRLCGFGKRCCGQDRAGKVTPG